MRYLCAIALVAGCASSGVTRHPVAVRDSYAVDSVVFAETRAGQLSASREWERGPKGNALAAADDAQLGGAFVRELRRVVPLDATAPQSLRMTLTLQDAGYFEGLATEASDVTLAAEILDCNGNVLRTITLREAASAPLQRSASRRARLEAAFDRLAHRLAAQL